ncbi:sensor histidine kinase [Marinospirillum perlucidum]|uniref:sensor histidine kinase n=1 Tax=Marinospirillum perlucidum TaxID=1982602 RepID=UPI00138FB9FB|nr:PhnD/SsuA/transferrin family substrate-binding protein [Marinospirillum perlucidum]
MGILAWRDLPELHSQWQPTLDLLQQSLPEVSWQLHWLTHEELEAALASGQLDFVLTNPGHYVDLSSRYPLAPLATRRDPHALTPHESLGSVLVTLAQRQDLQHLADLEGQTLGIVSPQAFGGFQLIADVMLRQGFDWTKELQALQTRGFPMEELLAALDQEQVDAVVLRSCLLESLAASGQLALDDYRILSPLEVADYTCATSTRLFPDWPFLSLQSTDSELARQVAVALLTSSQGRWVAPVSYQPVYEVFERLQVGPFSGYSASPLVDWLIRHRELLLLLASLLLLVFIHHLRTGYLVRQRTRELREAERNLRHQQAEILEMSRFALMGELTAGLAHELNQPLTSVVNYARGSRNYLLRPEAAEFVYRESLLDAMNKLAAQGEQAAAIIKNLRLFLRKSEPVYTWMQPETVCTEALELLAGHLSQHQINVTCSCTPELPAFSANRVEVLQILMNLLTNAIEALLPLEVENRHLSLSCSVVGNSLVFAVEDSGPGLQGLDPQKILTPFYTTKEGGMGLGLSLSQTLAKKMGGHLLLRDNPRGEGLLALFSLPLSGRPLGAIKEKP